MRALGLVVVMFGVGLAAAAGFVTWQNRSVEQRNRQAAERHSELIAQAKTEAQLYEERQSHLRRCWKQANERWSARRRRRQSVALVPEDTRLPDRLRVPTCEGLLEGKILAVGPRAAIRRAAAQSPASIMLDLGSGAEEAMAPHLDATFSNKPRPPPEAPTLEDQIELPTTASFGISGTMLIVGLLLLRRKTNPHRLPSATPRGRDEALEHYEWATELEQRLIRASLQIFVRLNPINISLHEFVGILDEIKDDTENEDRANIIERAISNVDLGSASQQLREHYSNLDPLVKELLKPDLDLLKKHFGDPEARFPWVRTWKETSRACAADLSRPLSANHERLAEVEGRFQQLQEGLPRCLKIQRRSGWVDMALGAAVGVAGGFVGIPAEAVVGGLDAWEGWRNKGDKEFLEAYGRALDIYTETTARFAAEIEQNASPAIERVIAEHAEFTSQLRRALKEDSSNGSDISSTIDELLASTGEKPDNDDMAFFEMVLENLREEGLSTRAEAHIRRTLNLTD